MSAHMRKRPIDGPIEIFDEQSKTRFLIPKEAIGKLFSFLQPFQVIDEDESIPADEVFKDVYKKYGKVGAAIRGFRARDNMTQKQLAEKLKIRQSHVSEMEHGKRTIGKAMAHKLAQLFNTDYRMFL